MINITEPGWNSFDIPLSEFAGLDLASVHQMKLEGAPTQGNTTVYFDNLYVYKGMVNVNEQLSAAGLKVFPNPSSDHIKIEAKENISGISIFDALGQEVISTFPNQMATQVKTESLEKGVYLIRTSTGGKVLHSRFVKE